MYTLIDDLETEHGIAILSELCGQRLTRNQQPVRLFDQTRHSAEVFFRADERGKPYIQDFGSGKRKYPVTAYAEFCGVDFFTAKTDLIRQYYSDSMPSKIRDRPKQIERPAPTSSQVNYISANCYEPCRTHFQRNGLFEYLRFNYGFEIANATFTRYRLGTSRRWRYLGYQATCLPQFDIDGNLRQVKVIPFDAMNGRRVKKHQLAELWNSDTKKYEPTAPESAKIYFAGKQLARSSGIKEPNLKQCFFGEHLLKEHLGQSVAIVEGESTAIVCSILWPQYIWLATGGSIGGSWYSTERFSVLRDHDVVLWPDTGKYDDWDQRAITLRPLVYSLYVSDYMEKNTPVGMGNVDLRDLLTRPCYFQNGERQPVYGEVRTIDLCGSYPLEWDEPNPIGAVPMIIAKSFHDFL